MNKLFYATARNRSRNEMARFLLTANDVEHASDQVENALGRDWKVERVSHICETGDTVFREV